MLSKSKPKKLISAHVRLTDYSNSTESLKFLERFRRVAVKKGLSHWELFMLLDDVPLKTLEEGIKNDYQTRTKR